MHVHIHKIHFNKPSLFPHNLQKWPIRRRWLFREMTSRPSTSLGHRECLTQLLSATLLHSSCPATIHSHSHSHRYSHIAIARANERTTIQTCLHLSIFISVLSDSFSFSPAKWTETLSYFMHIYPCAPLPLAPCHLLLPEHCFCTNIFVCCAGSWAVGRGKTWTVAMDASR